MRPNNRGGSRGKKGRRRKKKRFRTINCHDAAISTSVFEAVEMSSFRSLIVFSSFSMSAAARAAAASSFVSTLVSMLVTDSTAASILSSNVCTFEATVSELHYSMIVVKKRGGPSIWAVSNTYNTMSQKSTVLPNMFESTVRNNCNQSKCNLRRFVIDNIYK